VGFADAGYANAEVASFAMHTLLSCSNDALRALAHPTRAKTINRCPGRRMDIALPLGALALSGVVMPFTGIGSQGRPRRAHSFTVRRMYFNF